MSDEELEDIAWRLRKGGESVLAALVLGKRDLEQTKRELLVSRHNEEIFRALYHDCLERLEE